MTEPLQDQPGSPVTVADVAREAGVGTSTVSRALNNQARVKPATRSKVLEAAERLGYVPNPAVASLVALRERGRGRGQAGTTAGEAQEPRDLLPVAILSRLNENSNEGSVGIDGLSRLGVHRGYRFEHFNTLLPQYRDPAVLGRMLRARGYVGVVLRRIIRDPGWFVDFPWSSFAVISTDAAFHVAPVVIVRSSQFEDVMICWEKMRAKGYRRIGALLPGRDQGRIENARRLGAWRECQMTVRKAERVPAYEFSVLDEATLQGAPDWVRRYRPDALISLLAASVDKVQPHLPEPLPAAVMNGAGGKYPGLNRHDAVERETVRLLDQLIRSSTYGLPPATVHHVISAHWIEAAEAGSSSPG